MATLPSKRASRPKPVPPASVQAARLSVIRAADPQSEADPLQALLAFDADEDIASIIPMPPSIPVPVRESITKTLAERFEFADALDAWLNEPNELLGGTPPFARIIEGDGLAVLRALGATDVAATFEAGCGPARGRGTVQRVR